MQLIPKLVLTLAGFCGGCEIHESRYHIVLPDQYLWETPYYMHPMPESEWRKM